MLVQWSVAKWYPHIPPLSSSWISGAAISRYDVLLENMGEKCIMPQVYKSYRWLASLYRKQNIFIESQKKWKRMTYLSQLNNFIITLIFAGKSKHWQYYCELPLTLMMVKNKIKSTWFQILSKNLQKYCQTQFWLVLFSSKNKLLNWHDS